MGIGNGPGPTSETLVIRDIHFTSNVPDTDGDGMFDLFEITNGLNPNSATDKFADTDHDGADNYSEFVAGTAANDPASLFTVLESAFDSNNGTLSITWSSVEGRHYRVQSSDSPGGGTWTDVSPNALQATTASPSTNWTGNPGAAPGTRKFFRIILAP